MPEKLGQSVSERSLHCFGHGASILSFVHSEHDASLSLSALLLLLLPEGSLCRFFFFLSPITFLDRMSAVKLPPMGITSCREPSWCVYRNHSDRVILVRVLQDFMVCNAGFPIELLQVPPCKGSGFISCADRVSSYPLICIKSS